MNKRCSTRIGGALLGAAAIFANMGAAMAEQDCDLKQAASTPMEAFAPSENGTVIDRRRGLMWMRCAVGQRWVRDHCTANFERFEYRDTFAAANEINRSGGFAGYQDWRIPEIEELFSIVEDRCFSPAIDQTFFPQTPITGYWSASPDPTYASGAMLVHFYNGVRYMGNKDQYWALRLVRKVQSGPAKQ